MTIRGVEVTASFDGELTEDQVDMIYTSFDSNFAIKSVDMVTDLVAGSITFLFGVEVLGFTDAEEESREIVEDALHAAFEGRGDSSRPELSASLVGAF